MDEKIEIQMIDEAVVLLTKGKYCPKDIRVSANLQEKSVTANGEVVADDGYTGLRKVTVNVESSSVENTYTVLLSALGTVRASVSVPKGQAVKANPFVPQIGSYAFLNWQKDGEAISFPYTPEGDETWEANMTTAWEFGVSGLGNSSPTLTRTFDNVGKGYSIDADLGQITTDFDDIFNFETVEVDGNTMVKIPKMYKRFDTIEDNQITAFTICNARKTDDYSIYPCFLDESGNELDYILISKGKATGTSSKATCVKGSAPLVNVTRAQMRTAARANGDGWQQFDWMIRQLIIDLFCVVFATTDSQSIFLGRTTGWSSAATVGNTWDIPTPCGWNLSTMQNKFFGIEDIFGNVYDWVDGVVFSGSTIYSTKTPSLFSDSTSNMVNSGTRATSDGYVSKLSYNTNQKFLNYPTAASGSTSTYYCDYSWYSSSGTALSVGGSWSYGSRAGLWSALGNGSASDSYSGIGGRLTYRPL